MESRWELIMEWFGWRLDREQLEVGFFKSSTLSVKGEVIFVCSTPKLTFREVIFVCSPLKSMCSFVVWLRKNDYYREYAPRSSTVWNKKCALDWKKMPGQGHGPLAQRTPHPSCVRRNVSPGRVAALYVALCLCTPRDKQILRTGTDADFFLETHTFLYSTIQE